MSASHSAALPTRPLASAVPTLDADEAGTVIWHRDHLRVRDQPAVAAAATDEHVLPLFVFDPAFYGSEGLACDARVGFLHDCLADLDAQYRRRTGRGLTYAHGDPIDVLGRFREAGWDVVAAAGPSGRYGHERDRRARDEHDVAFVSGDGLVRHTDRPRRDWQARVEAWFEAEPHEWDPATVTNRAFETEVTIDSVADAYDVVPQKSQVPTGGTERARARLEAFAERTREYPGNISSPVDARDGTSGLSPYLKFGCLSVREVYQYVDEHAPDGRGAEMFVSRLFWNKHYEQKLEDWPGWLDAAANPVLTGFNADRHDPELIDAWKRGRTGYPMVDASMRCLAATGWLNFRMRALCVSFYYHVLQQPWQIGADWYHHHLLDSVASINYTQWQSQCGLVGRPTLRRYNPRKQVRDQDPDGEFITRWVPELEPLPTEYLDRPEHTPLAVQEDCGVVIGETYPRPIVDYESARAEFRERFGAVRAAAADALADPDVADRASLSGGRSSARAIARKHGTAAGASRDDATQTHLDAFGESEFRPE
ncbi:deoxyribodipyrimidine photo-lyase/cryptochrome family protein [Halobellus sp. Atlit-31R]|nr:deoxyribodipyrimidine photo-lyase/cryptochrome family protein [Halobellus sp. Atlit-31R]